jgi:hypothetical protein
MTPSCRSGPQGAARPLFALACALVIVAPVARAQGTLATCNSSYAWVRRSCCCVYERAAQMGWAYRRRMPSGRARAMSPRSFTGTVTMTLVRARALRARRRPLISPADYALESLNSPGSMYFNSLNPQPCMCTGSMYVLYSACGNCQAGTGGFTE